MLRVERLKSDPLPPLSFEVANGECLAVDGPSGSGKTRLLRALADLDPASGHVFLDGVERGEMPAPAWRKAVRYQSAEPQWWSDTPRATLVPETAQEPRVLRLMSSLGLAPELLDRSFSQLSTGERQRLALVRTLIGDPAVLLLDEPTAALDVEASALVEELIRFQLLAGKTVLLASHDTAMTRRLAHARLELARPVTARAPAQDSGQGAAP